MGDGIYSPLDIHGRDIIDSDDNRVGLTIVIWFNSSIELFIPGGLSLQHRFAIAPLFCEMGSDSVRLPYLDGMTIVNSLVPYHVTKVRICQGPRSFADVLAHCLHSTQ